MNVKSNFDLHGIHSRKVLVSTSLLFVLALASLCIFFAFNDSSPLTFGTPDNVVSNEAELRNAVNAASEPSVIAFNNDITLTGSALAISAGKNITLTSISNSEIFKLIGANNEYTIAVEEGVLNLEGIVVTHKSGEYGIGVYNRGTLSMFGGGIGNNTAGFGTVLDTDMTFEKAGGGVFNAGSFSLFGGEISGNAATNGGGGVFNFRGNFDLYGGVIYGNNAVEQGGGVYSYTAGSGNGVLSGSTGSFNVKGGSIHGNTVTNKNGDADVHNWTTW